MDFSKIEHSTKSVLSDLEKCTREYAAGVAEISKHLQAISKCCRKHPGKHYAKAEGAEYALQSFIDHYNDQLREERRRQDKEYV